MKLAAVAVAGVGALLAGGAAPAAAAPGTGIYNGSEVPPNAFAITNPTTQCGKFGTAAIGDVATHTLNMTGVFQGTVGTGTATFTIDTVYYQNPVGTYSDPNCLVPGTVPGAMSINFGPNSCTGTGTYLRTAATVYLLLFNGSCGGPLPTIALFTGTQVPCGVPPLPQPNCAADPNAGSELTGTYVQGV